MVSSTLLPRISNVRISGYPENLSDHLPVEIDLKLDLDVPNAVTNSIPDSINWNKVKDELRNNYENVMQQKLDEIAVPDVLHGHTICNNCSHIPLMEEYYCSIINSIVHADSVLPRSRPSVQKRLLE